jgi:hypothetical protein
MSNKKMDQLITELENFLECWKQLHTFINLARQKKFSADDEAQFLEMKSVVVQEMELILSAVANVDPSREDIMVLISGIPSIRFLSELNEGSLRAVEAQWHKIFIGWQSMLGQLKVKQREERSKGFFSSLFGRKSS